MAEDRLEEGHLSIDEEIEVSGPLDVRRLQGNARCTRCRDANRDCYLERKKGNLRCLACDSAQECYFRRVIVKEGPTTKFTWEELIGDVSATTITTSPALPRSSKKRPYSAIAGDGSSRYHTAPSRPPPRFSHNLSSLTSDPSQMPTNASTSPYAKRKVPLNFDVGTEPYEQQDVLSMGAWGWLPNNDGVFNPYIPGSMPLDERESSVNQHVYDATDQLGNAVVLDQGHRPQILSPVRALMSSAYAPPPAQTTHAGMGLESPNTASSFPCPNCKEDLNTRSELRKHMARHTKPYHCNVLTCPRATDGFATRNDLERHQASVHNSGIGAKIWKCAVPDCKDRNKVWPRKDNFKAHLKRMHQNVDVEDILQKSNITTDEAVDKSVAESNSRGSPDDKPVITDYDLKPGPGTMTRSLSAK